MTKQDVERRTKCLRLAIATAGMTDPRQIIEAANLYYRFITSSDRSDS